MLYFNNNHPPPKCFFFSFFTAVCHLPPYQPMNRPLLASRKTQNQGCVREFGHFNGVPSIPIITIQHLERVAWQHGKRNAFELCLAWGWRRA